MTDPECCSYHGLALNKPSDCTSDVATPLSCWTAFQHQVPPQIHGFAPEVVFPKPSQANERTVDRAGGLGMADSGAGS